MNRTDSQLVTDYLDGDEYALKELIEMYSALTYNFVYHLGGKEDSEDIVQEVFVKVWKNLKKYNTEQNFKTWLFSIANNTTIDWMRKKKNVVFSKFDNEDGNNLFEETLIDTEPLADELVAIAQDKKIIENILEELSPEYRSILLLHYVDNFTFKEIGEILNKPLNTVKSRHHRALNQLRKFLEKINK